MNHVKANLIRSGADRVHPAEDPIVVNWLGGVAILALLVVLLNEQWIMSAFNEDLVHNRRMTLTELADRIGMALTSNQAACANSQVGKGRLRPLKILSNSSMTINSPLTGCES